MLRVVGSRVNKADLSSGRGEAQVSILCQADASLVTAVNHRQELIIHIEQEEHTMEHTERGMRSTLTPGTFLSFIVSD